jgi:hypothetical protein
MRKFACFNLLTEVYLYVRPELEDDWLRCEDEDTNSSTSVKSSQETLLLGEIQAYHNLCYWENQRFLKKSGNVIECSLAVQAMLDLQQDHLDVEGGSCRKFFSELKLESSICQQYETWLDGQGLVATAVQLPLPITFT